MQSGRGRYAILYPPTKLDPNITYNAAYFNSLIPPPNYIPGISRGAVGFTTRSDLGPLEKLSTKKIIEKLKEDKPLVEYTKKDQEADEIWKSIEERRQNRRKRKREEDNKGQNISDRFSDLKTKLQEVSNQEWMSIPDSYDSSIKRRKFETYTAVSDSVILKSQQEAQVKDLQSITDARRNGIVDSLRRIEESASGTSTSINPREYMSGLETQMICDTEVGELRSAREMMKGLTLANPSHAPGWIARARIEELAGKMGAARSIIKEGCEKCPNSEDIWLESSRLHPVLEAKSILAEAVSLNPHSEKIWIAASELEQDPIRKKKVLRKALDTLPQSLQIWKEAIEQEDDEENARILLTRAVECLPSSVELSLALARISDYTKAKLILNQIRSRVPNDPRIWITAAQLEESVKKIDTKRILSKAISELSSEKVLVERNVWIEYAKESEDLGCLLTCDAIISLVLDREVSPQNRKKTFLEDATLSIADNHIDTARSIFKKAVSLLPTSKGLWKRYIKMEEDYGTQSTLIEVSKLALQHIPDSELLWVKTTKTQFKLGDYEGARSTIKAAIEHIENSDIIYLAAVAVELKLNQLDRAEKLLGIAREKCESPIVWMKSALYYRNCNNKGMEKTILDEALMNYKDFDKLWLMRAQLEEDSTKTFEQLKQGLDYCPKSLRLWLSIIKLVAERKHFAQARALIDQAMLNIKSDLLWVMNVRIEILSGSMRTASQTLTRGLQEFPKSTRLWREQICFHTGTKRSAQAILAIQECDPDPILFSTIACIFWIEHSNTLARLWFSRALKLDYEFGDTWIAYYAFEKSCNNEETCQQMLKKIEQIQPQYGEKWGTISKQPQNYNHSVIEILKEGIEKFSLSDVFDRNNVALSSYCRESDNDA